MKGLNVYCNGQYQGFITSRAKSKVKAWVKANVVSTHMGQWFHSASGEYRYATTIGRTYDFVPATMDKTGKDK